MITWSTGVCDMAQLSGNSLTSSKHITACSTQFPVLICNLHFVSIWGYEMQCTLIFAQSANTKTPKAT